MGIPCSHLLLYVKCNVRVSILRLTSGSISFIPCVTGFAPYMLVLDKLCSIITDYFLEYRINSSLFFVLSKFVTLYQASQLVTHSLCSMIFSLSPPETRRKCLLTALHVTVSQMLLHHIVKVDVLQVIHPGMYRQLFSHKGQGRTYAWAVIDLRWPRTVSNYM